MPDIVHMIRDSLITSRCGPFLSLINYQKRPFVSSKVRPAVSGSRNHAHNRPKNVIIAKNQNVPSGRREFCNSMDGTAYLGQGLQETGS